MYGPVEFARKGKKYEIVATVRHDDECGNGHNTFSITGEAKMLGGRHGQTIGGCIHQEVAQAFPELAPFIKWHLVSTDEPLHYVANGLYWLGWQGWRDRDKNSPPNIWHFKSTILYGVVESDYEYEVEKMVCESHADEIIQKNKHGWTPNKITEWLDNRRDALMAEFRKAVESLGLVY